MTIQSMTGFARVQGHLETVAWTWEVKSVNAKGRDLRVRMPTGFEGVEVPARDRVQKRFKRGNIALTLTVDRSQAAGGWRLNQDMLQALAGLLPELRAAMPEAEAPRLDGLLALRGVVEAADDSLDESAREAVENAMLGDLDTALERLQAMRAEEGARLLPVLQGLLDDIAGFQVRAAELAAAQPEAVKARLIEQVTALLDEVPALSEERLAQEAALLAAKADVREELDRLAAHVQAARELLATPGAVGRRLDFLCQEFNREANTLCSKSADVELTRVGLELKSAIEQMREQVQNIE